MGKRNLAFLTVIIALFGLSILKASSAYCQDSEINLSKGQSVYVPVYSNIFITDQEAPLYLSANLSIRNTNHKDSITILSVNYYNSDGKLVKSYLSEEIALKPMASTYFFIKKSDKSGGWGASFIVKWRSENKINAPLIECVMSGVAGTQAGIFLSRGIVINK